VSENVQETYPGTSAKNWNSQDDIPVVVVNSNSCRETLFSHTVWKKDNSALWYAWLSEKALSQIPKPSNKFQQTRAYQGKYVISRGMEFYV